MAHLVRIKGIRCGRAVPLLPGSSLWRGDTSARRGNSYHHHLIGFDQWRARHVWSPQIRTDQATGSNECSACADGVPGPSVLYAHDLNSSSASTSAGYTKAVERPPQSGGGLIAVDIKRSKCRPAEARINLPVYMRSRINLKTLQAIRFAFRSPRWRPGLQKKLTNPTPARPSQSSAGYRPHYARRSRT